MAEVVGLHVECMIPELEQMKRLQLFKTEEVNEIIKKRKDFEYKVERTMKEKQDFLRYINYEVKLLREIKLRRDKLRISEKKSEIEYAVAKRVVKLYQLALSYFKSDVKLWMSYINFCTNTRFGNVVSEAFKQMLQVHGDKQKLWIFAAKWELGESDNIQGALNYLKTGLHHHPDSQELYTEAFRLELKAGQKSRSTVDTSDQEKAALRAGVHFKAAVSAVGNDTEFIISLLDIATEFSFTESLQEQIIDYLTTNCWRSELMWHTMAQRELQGHHYSKADRHKSNIQLCIAVYKSAIKILPTSAMWEKYLDTLIEIYHDDKRNKNFKQEILENSFQNAYDCGFLVEKHYLVWLEMLKDSPKYLETLVMATAAIPLSVELWLTRLQHHISLDQEDQVKAISKEAINILKNKGLPVYRSLIKYYQIKHNAYTFNQEIKQIFEEGISKEPEISLPLRPQYIEWLSLVRNIKFARQEYEKLANKTPYCLELHKKMADLEMARYTPSVEIIRNIHKLACQQFGKDQTDVWMDYIKFELELGDAKFVSYIYESAKNMLNENLVNVFTTDYAILNSQ